MIPVIVANYAVNTRYASAGTKVYILFFPGDAPKVFILFRAKNGRYIERYEKMKRLTNYRMSRLHPDNPITQIPLCEIGATPYMWDNLLRLRTAYNC